MEHPEQDLQIELVTLLKGDPRRGIPSALPRPWRVWANKNHGEQKTKRMHGIHKAMGVDKGATDVMILGPGSSCSPPFPGPALFVLELKRPPKLLPSGNLSKAKMQVSDDQRSFIADAAASGAHTLVSRDIREVFEWLASFGVPLRMRPT